MLYLAYGEYLSPAQRESILKFVVENPGSAPPKYLTAPSKWHAYDNI